MHTTAFPLFKGYNRGSCTFDRGKLHGSHVAAVEGALNPGGHREKVTVRHPPASMQLRKGVPFLVDAVDRPHRFSVDGEPGAGDAVGVAGDGSHVLEERPPLGEPPPAVDVLVELRGHCHHDQVPASYLTVRRVDPVQADGFAVGEVQPERPPVYGVEALQRTEEKQGGRHRLERLRVAISAMPS